MFCFAYVSLLVYICDYTRILIYIYYFIMDSSLSGSISNPAETVKRRSRPAGTISPSQPRAKSSKTSSSKKARSERPRPPSSASVYGTDPDPGSPRGSADSVSAAASQPAESSPLFPSPLFPSASATILPEAEGSVAGAPAVPQDPPPPSDFSFREEFEGFRRRFETESLQALQAAFDSQSQRMFARQEDFNRRVEALLTARTPSVPGRPPFASAPAAPPRPLPSRSVPRPLPSFPSDAYGYSDSEDEGAQPLYAEAFSDEDSEEGEYEDDYESDTPLPDPLSTSSLTRSEVRSVLEVLRDSLGLSVEPPAAAAAAAPAVTQHSVFFTSAAAPSPTGRVCLPIDPSVGQRTTQLAATKSLPSRPAGSSSVLPLLPGSADLVSPMPVPRDAWDRLLAFGKAKSKPESSSCSLVDTSAAKFEGNLAWFSSAASHGAELCALHLYVAEWLHRTERGLLPSPSPGEVSLMLGVAAKLARCSLDQHLRVWIQANRLRRSHLLPLCDLPPAASQRFAVLPFTGPDLFCGRFQELVVGEAERSKALKETTFTLPSSGPAGSGKAPFRSGPSRAGGYGPSRARGRRRQRGARQGATGRRGGWPQSQQTQQLALPQAQPQPQAGSLFASGQSRGQQQQPRGKSKGRKGK